MRKFYLRIGFVLGILFSQQIQGVFGQDLTPPPTFAVPSPIETPIVLSTAVSNKLSLEKAGAQVLTDRPWLNDLYSWNETYHLDKQPLKINESGAYCIGNGKTFALIGLASPLWSWSNIYGDSYQEPDLGALHMSVTRAGVEAWMPQQQIGWVRRSGVVKVHAEGNGLTVETYDFAPVANNKEDSAWDNPPVLVRLVHLTNTSDHSENDLDIQLKIQSAWNVKPKIKVEDRDLVIDQKAARAKRRTLWRLAAFNPRYVRVWDNNLHYSVPSLKAGGETWAAFFLLSADSNRENVELASDIRQKGALALLNQTYDYYQKWFSQGTEFSGDSKVADLFDIESTIFKCQQSHSGGFSPLIGYSYTWIRDNNGPIRWFLKTGHPVEARKAMDFFYGVGSSMGSLPNSIRVDYPLNYHLKDLSNMHVEHAETPNWIVLQHWWYYLTTGDIDFIRSRWTYLNRCVLGQTNVDNKYFFHRDETYLWCLESRCFEQVPFPNYYLSTYAFATDSSFDLVSAADHLAYMGKFLEMDKDVSELKKLSQNVRNQAESTYWNEKTGYWAPGQSLLGPLYNSPFANILINPFWCGYARNDLDPLGETPDTTKKAIEAFKNAYPALGREDGFWKTTPTVNFFVGMNPGQLLYAFCKARLPWAEKAYKAVFKTVTPSGEFAEMYDGNYHPWNPPAWGVGTSGRVRPWEGGLNTESILEFLTGFAPDAGNNRVVFSPHMPEDQKEFSAKKLLVGHSQVSLDMKRNSPKQWSFSLHLEKGLPLDITVDFWASHNLLGNVESQGAVTWDKTAVDGNGREARCHLNLSESQDFSFIVTEDAALPEEELNPPKPQTFQPEPYAVSSSNLLLITSPTGIFNKHKHTDPEKFVTIGRSELKLMSKVTALYSFLDIDLPVSPADIADGLLDEKGNPKVKVAVFGRGAFSSGKHHFKPETYWSDSKFSKAVKKFMEEGGCLFIGPSYPDREVLPDWLLTLTKGGWEEGTLADKVVTANVSKAESHQRLIDEVDVDNADSEKNHAVTFEGGTYEDTQKLSDGQDLKKLIEDKGRGFTSYYQFTLKTEPGSKHRLWIRVNTGRNIKGMSLAVQEGDQWVQLGIRTQNDGDTRHFEALYFEIPSKYVTNKQTVFRLISKTGDEINAYHLWIYQLDTSESQTLPEILGINSNQEMGPVSHGLIPKSKEWRIPLVLSQHPEQGALILLKVGKGYLVRSELTLEDSVGILKSFVDDKTIEELGSSWTKP